MKIQCLLVDDEPLALDDLESLIRKIPDLEIAGKCQNAVDSLQVIHEKCIDLLLLDINRYHDRRERKKGTREPASKSPPRTLAVYSDKKN